MINNRKVILVTNIMSPYRIATFNQLASKYGKAFKVVFCKQNDRYRKWKLSERDQLKFDFCVLNDFSIKLKNWEIHLANGLLSELIRENPCLVITEGFGFPTIFSFLYTSIFHKKLILFSAETQHAAKSYSRFRHLLRKLMVRNAQGFIVTGTQAKEYLVSLKAPEEKIFLSYFSIDPELLGLDTNSMAETKKRSEGPKKILYVGKFTERKRVDLLISAFKQVKKRLPKSELWLVGEGEEEAKLKKLSQETKDVFFEGHKQYGELLPYYLNSDLFVLPTLKDVWGLVVNEAMMCGLPVICSKYAGCSQDLIKEGENGLIVDPENSKELSAAMSQLLPKDGNLSHFGQRSKEIIKDFTTERTTRGFVEAIEFVASKEKDGK
ncbi:MAG: glycosyltransferase family 4 protein [candidate division Zixibacteria bacterium]|nr:glycosyltransferase family 4 protein [candidate division Zixibacteria bacterium]